MGREGPQCGDPTEKRGLGSSQAGAAEVKADKRAHSQIGLCGCDDEMIGKC